MKSNSIGRQTEG